MYKFCITLLAIFIISLNYTSALAASDSQIDKLKREIQNIKNEYENRITELENKLKGMEDPKSEKTVSPAQVEPLRSEGGKIYSNDFNPSIGVILNGKYSDFSSEDSEIAGFGIGEEGERGREGIAIDESELNFAANVDDKFYGSLTTAIVREEGEDKVELEEAFIQTTAGMGLPNGISVKAGRAFWILGYLNGHHTHADDFADRPLPYRVFLNNGFNDDGVEVSYVLPTELYTEIGGGIFRGDDFPFGGATGTGPGAWSAYARVGGDIGYNMSWRIGGYILSGDSDEGRVSNEDTVTFIGDCDLYLTDLRFTWAPTGNPHSQEVTFQGEYIWRDEDGSYEDSDAETGPVPFNDKANGWYAQAVYKFSQQWRIGARYSRLDPPDVPSGLVSSILDSGDYNPSSVSAMIDWSNSEFSRLRLQYNHEELSSGMDDNQIILQYTISLGAHGAHAY